MRLLVALVIVVSAVGCGQPEPVAQTPPPPQFVEIPAGTEIKLQLLDSISSGDPEGTDVPFVVAEDVKDSQGKVGIRRGSVYMGKIENSRAAGALSGLMNEPARLSISVPDLKATDGTTVAIRLNDEDEPLHLGREETAKYASTSKLEGAMSEEAVAKLLRQLAEDMEEGRTPNLESDSGKQLLGEVAKALDLRDTADLLRNDRADDIQKAIAAIKGGSVLDIASGGTAGSALGAAYEIINVAEEVRDRVAGVFKGRNIRAYAGMPITAWTKEDVRIRL
jgi:hypothetical protein